MNKPYKSIPVLALALAAGFMLLSSMTAFADDEARRAKILANLKLTYPQLEQMQVTLSDFEPSGFEGLEQGSFTINTPQGPQTQKFFLALDDSKLFLIGAEVDVSRTEEQIAAEVAKKKEAEAKKAAEARAELASASVGLPVRGNPEAAITIVEFSDFQCPFCSRGAATIEQVLEKYGDEVKIVFKHFPLDFHQWAKPAAIASHCAGLQNHDAFWTLHDKYFEAQKEITPENVLEKSKEFLADAGIDMGKWSTCAEDKESEEYKATSKLVDDDMAFGQKMGVSGTPGFFVNGRFLNGALPLSAFEPLIAEARSDS